MSSSNERRGMQTETDREGGKKRGKNRDRLAGVSAILDNRDQDEGVKRKCGLLSSPGSLSDR